MREFDAERKAAQKRVEHTTHFSKTNLHFNEIAPAGLEVARAARIDEENTSQGIIHVQDGKPLTAHGAKLLGVKWPRPRT